MCFGRRAPEASGSSVGLHSRWDYQFQILLLLISVAYYFVIVVCSYVSSFRFLIVAAWSPCRWALKGNFSIFVAVTLCACQLHLHCTIVCRLLSISLLFLLSYFHLFKTYVQLTNGSTWIRAITIRGNRDLLDMVTGLVWLKHLRCFCWLDLVMNWAVPENCPFLQCSGCGCDSSPI